MLTGEFKAVLEADGLERAIRVLNQAVPYRYTAIFEFVGDQLRNICFIDKLDPKAGLCAEQSVTDSYCLYVRNTRKLVDIVNAMNDARTLGHSKREVFLSYYGVPLFAEDGRLKGTVCHFDESEIKVTHQVASDLDNAAPVIVQAAFRGA